MPHNDRDLGPATPSVAHQRQADAVKICRDVYQGTRHMRSEERSYLPQFPKEEPDAYKERLARSVLFNALKRTIGALVGMIMRKDPKLGEETPDQIFEHAENIDLAGRDLTALATDHLTDAMVDGHAHLFVDMQEPPDAANLLEEREAGNRPYWVPIRKQDVLRFRTTVLGGATVLTEFAYHEVTVERDPDNEWGEHEVDRVREYFLADASGPDEDTAPRVHFRIWRLDPEVEWPGTGESDEWTMVNDSAPDPDTMAIGRIPVATTYTGRTGFMRSDPPFEDLAHLNIRHYQTDSDNETLARTAKVPILTFIGTSEDKVESTAVGPGHALVLEDVDASVAWTQADGTSYKDFADDLQRIEQRMAVLGLSMLMSESRAAETAESKRIDKAESDSRLASIARNLQGSLNEALSLHGRWLDIEDPGSITVNMDFESEPLDPSTIKELRELWAARGISWTRLIRALQRGERFEEFDIDEERRLIAEEDGMRMDAAMGEVFGGDGGPGSAAEDEE